MASRFMRNGPNIYNNKEIRIVLVGKTGAGKSSTGNTILGEEKFKTKFAFKSFTKECNKADGEVDGQQVAVIDTPGLFDTCEDEEKTVQDVAQSICYASPGPHIFLVVIKLDRFTEEEKKTVQMIQQIFGQEADKYSMVLFTHGDQLEDEPIEVLLKGDKDLQKLVSRCNGQYHVFNNKLKDHSQVRELLNKIKKITKKNGGSHYTTEMFQKAEKMIEEEKQRIQRENEEQRRKEQEELEKEIDKKYEEKIRKMKADREKQEKQLREAFERQQREAYERQQRETYERQQRETYERQQRETYERQQRETYERQQREAYERQQRETYERQLKEYQERKLAEQNAEWEGEKKERLRKQKEEQDKKDRRKAEESGKVKAVLIGMGLGLGALALVGVGWGIGAGIVAVTGAGSGTGTATAAAVATASSCCIS